MSGKTFNTVTQDTETGGQNEAPLPSGSPADPQEEQEG